jgi:hypothetical protein
MLTRGIQWRGKAAPVAALVCIAAAGCGGGQTQRVVTVSVIAPTDGATLSVRSVEVLGNVSPRDSVVVIDGRRASVENGVFRLPLALTGTVTRIRIDATAAGYMGARTVLTVDYRPQKGPGQTSAPPAPVAAATAPSPPSVATAEHANRLCAARNAKVTALPPITPATVAADATRVQALNTGLIEQLQRLAGAAAGSTELGQFVDSFRRAAAEANAVTQALLARRVSLAARLVGPVRAHELKLYSQSAALGIPACGLAALMLAGSGRE